MRKDDVTLIVTGLLANGYVRGIDDNGDRDDFLHLTEKQNHYLMDHAPSMTINDLSDWVIGNMSLKKDAILKDVQTDGVRKINGYTVDSHGFDVQFVKNEIAKYGVSLDTQRREMARAFSNLLGNANGINALTKKEQDDLIFCMDREASFEERAKGGYYFRVQHVPDNVFDGKTNGYLYPFHFNQNKDSYQDFSVESILPELMTKENLLTYGDALHHLADIYRAFPVGLISKEEGNEKFLENNVRRLDAVGNFANDYEKNAKSEIKQEVIKNYPIGDRTEENIENGIKVHDLIHYELPGLFSLPNSMVSEEWKETRNKSVGILAHDLETMPVKDAIGEFEHGVLISSVPTNPAYAKAYQMAIHAANDWFSNQSFPEWNSKLWGELEKMDDKASQFLVLEEEDRNREIEEQAIPFDEDEEEEFGANEYTGDPWDIGDWD